MDRIESLKNAIAEGKKNLKKAELTQLVELAVEAKALGHDVFVDYAAHIDSVTVRIYVGGWDTHTDPKTADYDFRRSFDPKYADDTEWGDCVYDEMVGVLLELVKQSV